MAGNLGGFVSQQEAEKLKTTSPGELLNWPEVYDKLQ
jgi:hypothetical protein